ncbi:hypothetical protein [Paenibacillus humicola]|uniref:hypothetical protein n=1 Tax=Paenibacillus humicola TaxID=3110540 RepID=UPI00237B303C|nr:hypothetical protein [Paenibacillus humicola]
MHTFGSNRHQERVEAVVEIIKAVTGQDLVPDACIAKLNAMSFEELGTLVMRISSSRTADDLLRPLEC